MTLFDILLLYLAFRAKQLACDFLLQNAWMACNKGKPFSAGGLKPLAAHAGVHAAGTLVVVLAFAPAFWWLALADFFIHGAVDKTKAMLSRRQGWTYNDKAYWWVFGLDQEVHNLTHLWYLIMIVLAAAG